MSSVFVLLLLCLAIPVRAATLHLATPHKEPGYWAIPVELTAGAGESVASLQFDVHFSEAYIDGAGVGERAEDADKDVVLGDHGDYVSLLVAGINQNGLGNGTVAWIFVADDGRSATEILQDLTLANAVLASPEGAPVAYEAPVPERDRQDADEATDEEESGGASNETAPLSTNDTNTETDAAGALGAGYANGNLNYPGEAEGESNEAEGQVADEKIYRGRPGTTPGRVPSYSNRSAYGAGDSGQRADTRNPLSSTASTSRYNGRTHGGVSVPSGAEARGLVGAPAQEEQSGLLADTGAGATNTNEEGPGVAPSSQPADAASLAAMPFTPASRYGFSGLAVCGILGLIFLRRLLFAP